MSCFWPQTVVELSRQLILETITSITAVKCCFFCVQNVFLTSASGQRPFFRPLCWCQVQTRRGLLWWLDLRKALNFFVFAQRQNFYFRTKKLYKKTVLKHLCKKLAWGNEKSAWELTCARPIRSGLVFPTMHMLPTAPHTSKLCSSNCIFSGTSL